MYLVTNTQLYVKIVISVDKPSLVCIHLISCQHYKITKQIAYGVHSSTIYFMIEMKVTLKFEV